MTNLDGLNSYNNPLNHMDTMEILERIERYKKVDLKRISNQDLFNLTLETLPILNINSRNLVPGTRLYRIRLKDSEKLYRNISEVSYPGKNLVTRRRRLNDVGESMLYTSLDSSTPFYEAKAKVNQSFAFTEFEVVEGANIQVTTIGIDNQNTYAGLNEQGKINNKILEQFLYTEFTKDVGIGTEHLYRISHMLVKNFFDIPHCDGYMFPSVAFKNGLNIAVKPISVDKKLRVNKVINLKVIGMTESGTVDIAIESESTSVDQNGNINYE